MVPTVSTWLAGLVLAVHVAIIAFNVFGLVAIPLGAWRGWSFVRVRSWRILHLLSFAVVALQSVLGRACFLTDWQADLTGGGDQPLIMRWVNSVIFWPLPVWVFEALYIALFASVLALYWLVPPIDRRRDPGA
ncbi:MAG TPA: DUF2784 domain-containing protein [Caulobacteraceae bacterium]|nr:DUF2784 domain-containing protein [Caulobacteraceae bacterium]